MDYLIRAGAYCNTTYNPKNQKHPMHMHDNYEIYSFLSGDAEYYVEGSRYPLKSGDIILIRKNESHQLVLKSNAPYSRCVINFEIPFFKKLDPENKFLKMFDDRPLGKFNHYPAVLFPDNNWQYYLKKMTEVQDKELRFAYLLPLLVELSSCFEVVKNSTSHLPVSDQVTSIIRYINQNLQEELSLSLLCEHFYLSKAHLNRIFKQATGSTVWNYILIKRLILAREMLSAGKAPTEVFLVCGFQDYTTFYRAYKKHFGVSPKQDRIV